MTCGLEKVDRQGLFVPEGTHRTFVPEGLDDRSQAIYCLE
jgi:hypothetical protein